MRLDKFLKVSRLIKRRTVANTVSEMGRVLVNGNSAKPAKQLKVGDIIEIEYASKTEKVEVLVIPTGNGARRFLTIQNFRIKQDL